MAALLPPDGSAGSGHRKEFPLGAVSGNQFVGVARSNLFKLEGVVKSTRRVNQSRTTSRAEGHCLC